MFRIVVSPLLKLRSRAVGVLAWDVGTTANGREVNFEDVGGADDLSGISIPSRRGRIGHRILALEMLVINRFIARNLHHPSAWDKPSSGTTRPDPQPSAIGWRAR